MQILKGTAAALLGAVVALTAMLAGAAPLSAAPYTGGETIGLSVSDPCAGGKDLVTGQGFAPNGLIDITLHTTVYALATIKANPAGRFSVRVGIPNSVPVGAHTIVAIGRNGGSAHADITVRTCRGTGPSTTGVAVLSIGTVAIVLLGAGILFLIGGRRRRARV